MSIYSFMAPTIDWFLSFGATKLSVVMRITFQCIKYQFAVIYT